MLGGIVNTALTLMMLPQLLDPLDEVSRGLGGDLFGRKGRARKLREAQAAQGAYDSADSALAEQQEQSLNSLLARTGNMKGVPSSMGEGLRQQFEVDELVKGHEQELGMMAEAMNSGPTLEELAFRMGY